MSRARVVLPDPFGPTRAKKDPRRISSPTSCRIGGRPGKAKDTPSRCTAGNPGIGGGGMGSATGANEEAASAKSAGGGGAPPRGFYPFSSAYWACVARGG